jgi:hypothetical protein
MTEGDRWSNIPPGVLGGVDSHFNEKDAPGFDAFDPDTRGASAGLNFEHIISGHRNQNNKFAPRMGKFELSALADGKSARLVRAATILGRVSDWPALRSATALHRRAFAVSRTIVVFGPRASF